MTIFDLNFTKSSFGCCDQRLEVAMVCPLVTAEDVLLGFVLLTLAGPGFCG